MIRAWIGPLLLVSILAGAAIGYFTSPAEATSVFYSVRVNPGALDYLTCTWHGTCGDPPTAGTSLDWGKDGGGAGGTAVFFRGWNARNDTPYNQAVAKVYTATTDGTCKEVTATVKDNDDDVVGYIYYTHTYKNATTEFTLYGNYNYNYQTKWIATIASSDLTYCPWKFAHLHQGKSSVWSYNYSRFNDEYEHHDIFGLNDWQYYDSWILW